MGRQQIVMPNDYTRDSFAFLSSYGIRIPGGVLQRLMASPEFIDEPLADGAVRIVRRIAAGTVSHVGHAAWLVLRLWEAGLALPEGVSIEEILRGVLYHDLGKNQPQLRPGDVVLPGRVFENGKLHAARSAQFLRGYGEESALVRSLVFYHHHGGGELPLGLTEEERAALAVLQLVDGLSAAIVRRNAAVYVVWDELCPELLGVQEVHPGTGRTVYHKFSTVVRGGKVS